ncbi:hypothetical protein [Gordonia sp. (in: high G+C Gram-positive bacteria)]|uniref:hypothetical protein n=1 Tax=Gordonia sp. (in: high G+C Gram-positive bacteria) TaxID=84139 RepID=UPI001D38EF3F|nr:hypothetical protein [Gordonia sp. (in: high G+C Gram-positive bacteria)]MCB1293363.1 hypothetical protein [Gordonia sp. (in: high G+C Gram-positive bacteria)]HMS77314.1 hypothetical protein [Gordonia sp. (in: high G+C Gram-positive bacteria)]HQV18927.1 hypothetical protein [Gordonia sp. (in: high G+C Gram-positive bacteria)]
MPAWQFTEFLLENNDLPQSTELAYYREMTRLLPTRAGPAEGYGEVPKTEVEVLARAAARVQANLPERWMVRTAAEIRSSDTTNGAGDRVDPLSLSLVRDGVEVLTYVIDVRRTVGSNPLSVAVDRLLELCDDNSSQRPMLVARYLSPQQRQTLQGRGIAYADATGNLWLVSDDPLILLSDRGASADPWRGPGRPTTNLKGLPAAKLVRALVDFVPPYSVAELAAQAGASIGAAYRLSDYLVSEGLLTRADRGPITDVDWPELLSRWSRESPYLDTSTTYGFLEPRGIDALVTKLAKQSSTQRYAVSGSVAAQPYAPYADARLSLIYTDDPATLAAEIGLRPVAAGANVLIAVPRSPVVFERTSTWRDITVVAPSQAVADLLSGPGRNPAEGDYLLSWMKENEDVWRRQLDR